MPDAVTALSEGEMAVVKWDHVVEHVHGQRWVTVTGINEVGEETDIWGTA